MKAINMVTILVFDGVGKEDLDKFLRQFKRVCMANGNRDERAQYN
jgi:ribosomal protein S21